MKPGAMSRCVAVWATAAFLWTIALGVSPGLHERVHAGQQGADHSCAVTFVRTGGCHHTPAPALDIFANVAVQFATLPELSPCWVASPFLTAAIFEHAPPAIA
ncbi:MAG TPA: hypothetical protein VJ719_07095 [Chthoniobacterales bacterium]|nr:hypothetical protein [Chthoniobacterales bacterium]